MPSKRQIKWEKYENYVNQNLAISKMLMTGEFVSSHEEDHDDDDDSWTDGYDDRKEEEGEMYMQFPLTPELMSSIKISSNFDCWFGHTNFGITQGIAEELNEVEGIELLKIVSKYRFLVGLGKMFDFKEVRKNIQTLLEVGQ